MGADQSKLFRRSLKASASRYAHAIKRRDAQQLGELLNNVDDKVVTGISGLVVSSRNIRFAARQLRLIASKNFRCPRGMTHENVIVYHNTVALHEFTAYVNRFVRLFKQLERHFKKVGKRDREQTVAALTRAFIDMNDQLTDIRNEHVHGKPFVPPALSQDAVTVMLHPEQFTQQDLIAANKLAARAYSVMWVQVIDLMEAVSEMLLDVAALLFASRPSMRAIERRIRDHEALMAASFPVDRASKTEVAMGHRPRSRRPFKKLTSSSSAANSQLRSPPPRFASSGPPAPPDA
jgi:hypothetical protein